MRGSKTAVWRNALGQEIVFDNYTFFLESIDMTGTAGVHTVESLAMTDGQVTLDHHLGAKTIPCSFAWKDVKGDRWMQAYLTSLFNPTVSGTLTVYTPEETYSIDCYPQDSPTFQRDSGVSYVWRWNVDFVADYPYWRKGTQRTVAVADVPMEGFNRVLVSRCPFEIAPEIVFPATSVAAIFQLYPTGESSKEIRMREHADYAVRVITQDFKVIREDTGADCSELISATTELDTIRIRRGKNTVMVSPDNGVLLSYYNLSMGEV